MVLPVSILKLESLVDSNWSRMYTAVFALDDGYHELQEYADENLAQFAEEMAEVYPGIAKRWGSEGITFTKHAAIPDIVQKNNRILIYKKLDRGEQEAFRMHYLSYFQQRHKNI